MLGLQNGPLIESVDHENKQDGKIDDIGNVLWCTEQKLPKIMFFGDFLQSGSFCVQIHVYI